uniref:Dihydrolipoyl dehydrogenase n=1 Tax=Stylophora pistillata TaxID=50429 RepID=A0A2B4REB3_STYPI
MVVGEENEEGVDCIVCNTDKPHLDTSPVSEANKILLGYKTTKGLGTGDVPEIGAKAAEENIKDIETILIGTGTNENPDTHMLFITAGMGKGTGTGASPLIAAVAKKLNILTVAFATMPPKIEGSVAEERAKKGLKNLKENVDSLILLSNQKLNDLYADSDLSVQEVWENGNKVLSDSVLTISNIVTIKLHKNVDLNDVKNLLKGSGSCFIGYAEASGKDAVKSVLKKILQHSEILNTHKHYKGANKLIATMMCKNILKMADQSFITSHITKDSSNVKNFSANFGWEDEMTDMQSDIALTVIATGSGPGGYVCAIRSSQLGLKTALVEKYDTLGGTCLNVGCIPSKALLDSSHHYYDATKHFDTHGIDVKGLSLNFEKMIARKAGVVSQTSSGINYLLDKNNVDLHHGTASFFDKNTLHITGKDGAVTKITTDKTVIATGSKPGSLPFVKIDKKRIITSTEALSLKEIPKHLVVIGGGVIGLELGQVYARLGAEVSVVEYAKNIIPTMDAMLSKELQKSLKKQGFKFYTTHQVSSVAKEGEKVVVKATDKKSEEVVFEGDYCLMSVGRVPYTKGLGLENIGIKTNERGQIPTDENLQTVVENIYAIGDVVKGAMLAHKAEEEGVMVAEIIAGEKPHINYNLIPGVVYTWPEVASVGKTEAALKEANTPYKIGAFPMRALGRSRVSGDLDGQVKVLAHSETDEILGVHIIGARAADMIGEVVMAMEFRASAEDVARVSHAHPTFTEAIKEACLAATENRAIHN